MSDTKLAADLEGLKASFQGRLLIDPVEVAPFLTDFRRKITGRALAVAQPDSAEDVACVVRWCAENDVVLVPQGGNTGLVGGSVPADNYHRPAIVMSLKRMRRIIEVDEINNTITVEAGCILADVQQAAQAVDRLFPLSLGAEGSCTIGGNLSTNAGGIQVLRFGNSRDLCLGLQVVTAEGKVWDGLRGLRKDNTGYDLKQLFIGAEGTLGIITAATLKLFPALGAQNSAFVGLRDESKVLEFLQLSQSQLGASLTAFEMMDEACFTVIAKNTSLSSPFNEIYPMYVLLEISGSEDAGQDVARFQSLLEKALDSGIILDAAVASSMENAKAFWSIRHHVSEAQARESLHLKHDISLPISRIPAFLEASRQALVSQFPSCRVVAFGHVGDGNLHYNVFPAAGAELAEQEAFIAMEQSVANIVYDEVIRCGGSISAEHGIGSFKVQDNRRYKSDVEMTLMHRVKNALDPQNIFNPDRVIA